jgi:hypothetical protein
MANDELHIDEDAFGDVDAELFAAEVAAEQKPTKAELRWKKKLADAAQAAVEADDLWDRPNKHTGDNRLPEQPAEAQKVIEAQAMEQQTTMSTTDTAPLSHDQQKAVINTKEVMAKMEEVMREIGQIEAFDFINKLLTVSSLKIIQKIKETKSYKGLVYRDQNEELLTVSSWDEFCVRKLNIPRATVDDRLLNLNQLGEEFFEASQKIGLGYRELRKLRQLPEEQQQLVIENEAVDLGDKDALRELIDDLNAKHQKELKALKGEKEELDKSLKVARQMRDEAQAEANQFKEDIASRKFNPEAWKSDVSSLVLSVATLEGEILQRLNKLMVIRNKITEADSDDVFGADSSVYHAAMDYMAGAMYTTSRSLAEDVADFWQDTELMFKGYAQKAKPAVQVLEQLAASAKVGG